MLEETIPGFLQHEGFLLLSEHLPQTVFQRTLLIKICTQMSKYLAISVLLLSPPWSWENQGKQRGIRRSEYFPISDPTKQAKSVICFNHEVISTATTNRYKPGWAPWGACQGIRCLSKWKTCHSSLCHITDVWPWAANYRSQGRWFCLQGSRIEVTSLTSSASFCKPGLSVITELRCAGPGWILPVQTN